ncbi:Bifunctional dethiobiotin synthetase/7,8-diamino-pelargonic acid aminotransferase [Paramyrothecium foliicola]|nr:Bifunctional dethiobiotin synthetase/7,8-diamino-pelargonic acid aminotransferase [Paramyrothecium foliicola]
MEGKAGPLENTFTSLLARRKQRSQLRQLTLVGPDMVDFSSNSYLSLSGQPQIHNALLAFLQEKSTSCSTAEARSFLGSGGSRLLDGNSPFAEALERSIAAFHGAPAALLFNSGFDANIGLFSTVPQPGDTIVFDELIHASVHDGMKMSRAAQKVPFRHNSVFDSAEAAEGEAKSLDVVLQDLVSGEAGEAILCGKRNVFIAVEGIYSMDGDVAPLKDVVASVEARLPHGNGYIIVDEAHSTGFLGERGRGLVCELGLEDKIFARVHTFGKAMGCSGGVSSLFCLPTSRTDSVYPAVVLSSPTTRTYLVNYARTLIYTTAMALPSLASIHVAYEFLSKGHAESLLSNLKTLIDHTYAGLHELCARNRYSPHLLHLAPKLSSSPIIPLFTTEPRSLAKFCQQQGFMTIPTDHELLAKIHDHVTRVSQKPGWLFVETAGGVHSPGPSGNTQADIYAALRSPVILVGDSKLGGISQTISAFESLRLRGYDVEGVILFRDDVYENYRYLTDYFGEKYGIPVKSVLGVPQRRSNEEQERLSMEDYYESQSETNDAVSLLERFNTRHEDRITELEQMTTKAHQKIWYPFTQQKLLSPDRITTIDSAHGDYFQTLRQEQGSSNLLQPSFDGSASWWTQGLGHANPQLTLAAAYAAGRYGHVMFAESIHKPALSLAETLLANLRNPRLSRVFFSDNGSTGCEVAIKMALRAARMRYGWDANAKLGVLGLKGSYHGDTIGAMDCSEPCTFNEKVEWYEGKGYWFDYPTVKCTEGNWIVDVPSQLRDELGQGEKHDSLAAIFDVTSREQGDQVRKYEAYIEKTLKTLRDQGWKFGALMLEPVILGAGGMIFVDPLFQRTLVSVVRRSSELFGTSLTKSATEPTTWSGLPVVFDEVFTGLYRLGRYTSSSFLGTHPDISVHAKLLTGGLVPLCTTLASESVFDAFSSDDKSDALLHGHSYTAHPVGCQVALESLKEMKKMDDNGAWNTFKSNGWETSSTTGVNVWSVWSSKFVNDVSNQSTQVAGAWALGSVLAITLRSGDDAGYKSTAAQKLQAHLRRGNVDGRWNVHSRVLGNIFYLMAGQKTTPETISSLEGLILEGLSQPA